jgi:hypothetical protein
MMTQGKKIVKAILSKRSSMLIMESTISGQLLGLLNDPSRFGKNPMDTVADDIIIGWCDLDPRIRYRVAAAVVRLFKRPNDKAPYERASLTRQLLLKAPDPEAVFKEIVDRLHPTSWERVAGSSKPASRCSINSISTRSRSSRLPLMRPRRR